MADRCLLYYITDQSQFRGNVADRRAPLLEKIAEAARAGIDYIQLREKDLSTRDLQSLAEDAVRTIREARTANNEQRTALLINSRTDIALAAGADGVHLRSEDVSPMEVRRIWTLCSAGAPARERPIVAASCHNIEDVNRAQSQGADFAVFAPVFEKNTLQKCKPRASPPCRRHVAGEDPGPRARRRYHGKRFRLSCKPEPRESRVFVCSRRIKSKTSSAHSGAFEPWIGSANRTVPDPTSEPRRSAFPRDGSLMGCDTGQDNEKPVHRVWIDEFLLAACQVTNAEYGRFLRDTESSAAAILGMTPP